MRVRDDDLHVCRGGIAGAEHPEWRDDHWRCGLSLVEIFVRILVNHRSKWAIYAVLL